ncbi:hypothetical protein [Paenochrobactrum pullorum]|uniref:hypothetical protein n=1 Tax=Paenochrobactrum pullorum TaxID=1324351 RepID=UPI0035BBEBAE
MSPKIGPPGIRILLLLDVHPFLGPPGWWISGVWALGEPDAPEPFISEIGGLLPMAL